MWTDTSLVHSQKANGRIHHPGRLNNTTPTNNNNNHNNNNNNNLMNNNMNKNNNKTNNQQKKSSTSINKVDIQLHGNKTTQQTPRKPKGYLPLS